MKIKKNDQIKILTGKDKGKTGKVLQVSPSNGKLSIEGLNLAIKHLRPQRKGEKGQRIEFPAFIEASNVALVCPKCGKTTRVTYKTSKNEAGESQKFRACQKCKALID